jgi:N-methylhydantoinase A
LADLIIEETASVLKEISPRTISLIDQRLRELERSSTAQLTAEGLTKKNITCNRLVDARYLGQSFELTIPFTEHLEDRFHQAHQERYGYSFPDRTVEIVNLRLQAIGKTPKPTQKTEKIRGQNSSSALLGETTTRATNQQPFPVSLYDRTKLHPGAIIPGPALIFQMDSTTYIPPDWEASVDRYRNLILEFKK